MVRYKATIAYDGTNFQGFQRQPNGRTVQEEIEKTDPTGTLGVHDFFCFIH